MTKNNKQDFEEDKKVSRMIKCDDGHPAVYLLLEQGIEYVRCYYCSKKHYGL